MRSLFAAAAAVALPLTASAGGGHDAVSVVQHIFEVADLDADGYLTRSEYEGAGLQQYGVPFEDSDADADGRTSLAEYLELYERHHPPGDRGEA